MKYLVLIGDGMADFPLASLDGRTPIEAARTPAMDEVARDGMTGLFCPIPADLPPGSDIGNLSLFGYDPHLTFTGRAPIEAARQGIRLTENEVAFRCNLVTLDDGVMKSFTSGHISTEEARELIAALNAHLSDLPVTFHTGVSYRHLAVVSGNSGEVAQLVALKCTPPHDISDQAYAGHLPSGEGAALAHTLMDRSRPILADHPVNRRRADAGKPKATSIWLWGQGKSPRMETYQQRFGLTGAVVSAVDLVKGIGVCAGLEVIDVEGATGYLDTNYEGKVDAALGALEAWDFAYLHVEAPDETAHEGKVDLKIQAIEDFDRRVVAPCLEYARSRGDVRLLVAPDHVTSIETRTHAGGPVPFAMMGPGIAPCGAHAYSERAAAATGVLLEQGHTLVTRMLQTPGAIAWA